MMSPSSWAVIICVVCFCPFVLGQEDSCPKPPCSDWCWFHGRCDLEEGICVCDFGYTGPDCLNRTCDEKSCVYGTCLPDGSCSCDSGYVGENCDILVGVLPWTAPVCNLEGMCSCASDGRRCADENIGPDLYIENNLKPYVEYKHFDSCDCAVGDCVWGVGLRKLLRFDIYTRNGGTADLFIGQPAHYAGGENHFYKWHTCHNHPHFLPWNLFRLVNADTGFVFNTTKSGSTVIDSGRRSGDNRRRKYIDSRQGLQTGWVDWYPSYLDCQWIDITGLQPGNWVLEIEVNPQRLILEENYDNNILRHELECDCGEHGVCDFGTGCICDEGWGGKRCTDSTQECQPTCHALGAFCGSDGCGGSCGMCERHEHCSNGACVCTPRCEGKFCGPDSCGAHCGVCLGEGEKCTKANCVCRPNCRNRDCGFDGCDGLCGFCGVGQKCIDYSCQYVNSTRPPI